MINLLFTFDNNFFEQFLCTFRSILYSTQSKLRVFIFFHDQNSDNLRKLELKLEKLKKYADFEFQIFLFDDQRLKSFPININEHLTLTTYIRLLIPEYLSKDIEKIIYLDCDLIIRDDLKKIWNINLDTNNHYLAAVSQGRKNPMQFYKHFYKFKNFNRKRFDVFNAGVLLINLKLWRTLNLMPKFLDFIKENHRHLKFHDQDVLNYFAQDHWYKLSWYWNYCMHIPDKKNSIDQAKIIHYSSDKKPWQINYPSIDKGLEFWKVFWKTDDALEHPNEPILFEKKQYKLEQKKKNKKQYKLEQKKKNKKQLDKLIQQFKNKQKFKKQRK